MARCPRCGHENRAAISLSICDRCGCDISTAPELQGQPLERDLRVRTEEVIVQEGVTVAPSEAAVMETPTSGPPEKPPARRNPLAVVGRVLLAAAAVAVGVTGGISLAAGSALEADPQLAGSIAILAAAAAVCGLVLVLVGGSRDRSTGVTVGLRIAGFLLAAMGVWAVTVLSHGALVGKPPGDIPSEQALTPVTGRPMMGGPPMGMGPDGMQGGMMRGPGQPGGPSGQAAGPPPVGPPAGEMPVTPPVQPGNR